MRKGILIPRPAAESERTEDPEDTAARNLRPRVRPLLNAPGLIPDAAARPVGALGQSLGEFQAKAQRAEEIEHRLAQGQTIVELDPSTVDPSFVADRLPGSSEAHERLVESIRENGQHIPIMVRPHPETSGRYQVAFGHRRLRAVKELGRSVKAIVRNLTDDELVIAQGQENNERQDLSFIERSVFAHQLERRGFGRATITAALSVHKSDLSTMLSVVTRIPERIIATVGPAPKTGRRAWVALADHLKSNDALAELDAVISSEDFKTLDSDSRMSRLLSVFRSPANANATAGLVNDAGVKFATIAQDSKKVSLTIDRRVEPEFSRYLVERIQEIYETFKTQRSNQGQSTH